MELAPEAATRDGAWVVGAAEGLDGAICDAEALVGSTAETFAVGLAAGAPVSVMAGFDG